MARILAFPTTRLVLLVVVLATVVGGCGGDDGDGKARAAEPVSGSFVGTVPGTEAKVAVVAGKPTSGSDERPVRVYVCATEVYAEWFPGSASGNDVVLKSESGKSRLTVKLTPALARGRVTLPDGETRPFTARPATGVAGLYEVTLTRDGTVVGSSDRGVRVRGKVHRTGPEARAMTGELIPPKGSPLRFADETTGRPPFRSIGDGRWIFLADGSLSGSIKSRTGTEAGIWAGPNPR